MAKKIFSSVLSREADVQKAFDQLAEKINQDLNGESCDLALVFVSENYPDLDPDKHLTAFREKIKAVHLMACNCSGVVHDQEEVEMQPAISVMAMHLPDVKMLPFSFTAEQINAMKEIELIEYLDLYPVDAPKFICLADPMTCDINKLMNGVNHAFPGCPVIGGLASSLVVGTEAWLFMEDEKRVSGMIGMALAGDIRIETFVSQGCRPIGEPYIITKAEQNIVFELAGQPALRMLQDTIARLSPGDRLLAQTALFAGLAMDENQQSLQRGDFLVRNIMGVDEKSGAIAVGEYLDPGQTLQFQLRDAKASHQDLLDIMKKGGRDKRVKNQGAILISCCGRGQALFGEESHDARLIQQTLGPFPMTGFFANGEFGLINEQNYIHGYTSSLALIR